MNIYPHQTILIILVSILISSCRITRRRDHRTLIPHPPGRGSWLMFIRSCWAHALVRGLMLMLMFLIYFYFSHFCSSVSWSHGTGFWTTRTNTRHPRLGAWTRGPGRRYKLQLDPLPGRNDRIDFDAQNGINPGIERPERTGRHRTAPDGDGDGQHGMKTGDGGRRLITAS